MNYSLNTLFVIGSCYLAVLFAIAFVTDRGLIPEKIVRHPIVYVLSLGVFASVWAYYTSVGTALRDGYGYLAQSIGISFAFLLSPLILRPILQLTRTYQLGSLADLMAFRYRSPWAGTATTLVILVGVIPLIALQIRAVTDTANIVSGDSSQILVAFVFCLLITLFAILFGTSRRGGRTHYDGLVMAIAFESLVKLVAFLVVGLFAIYTGFGGIEDLNIWLLGQPELTNSLKETNYFSSFHVMALMFFTAAIAMPHMFYVTFNENNGQRALSFASWGLPLYILLISLPVLPILWAGIQSGSDVQVEYFPVVLGMEYGSPFFTLLAYLGGLSAASGLIIVITLALSNMCLNHLLLPIYQPNTRKDIYRWLVWQRRMLIAALIWAGFLFHYLPDESINIDIIGTVAFTACLQFLPGIVAILYWPQGNKKGFLSGLSAGVFIWFVFLMLPIFLETNPLSLVSMNWREIAAISLIVNCLLFAVVSLFSTTTDAERSSADICALDTIKRRKRSGLVAKSPDEFIRSLSKPLGNRTATREVTQALRDLNIEQDDRRSSSLRMLRGRLEANLSGLLGPSIARELIDGYLPYSIVSQHGSSDLNVIESRIETYRSNLSGMATDLDNLRRYHRQILLDLPLGVCSLSFDKEIVMWNRALENLTGINSADVVSSQVKDLDEPWLSLLTDFLNDDINHSPKRNFELDGNKKTVNLHKATIEKSGFGAVDYSHEGIIILLEDITETELLEASLTHSERLASIGRLAAGVAHEIGNPITGIACLAQTIRDEYQEEELNQLAQQIIEQTTRTSKILQSLVNFAHAGSNKSHYDDEIISIKDCMEEAIALISLDTKSKDLEYHIQCDPQAKIIGDSQRFLQVLVNLISNARDASQVSNKIFLQAGIKADKIEVAVIDEGVGISPSIRDRIFEPFYTTKEPGEGTGLGLSLVYSIVGDLKGEIDIISPANKDRGIGTQVILRFPCYHDDLAETGND